MGLCQPRRRCAGKREQGGTKRWGGQTGVQMAPVACELGLLGGLSGGALHLLTAVCPACSQPPLCTAPLPVPGTWLLQDSVPGAGGVGSSCWSQTRLWVPLARGAGFRVSEGGLSASNWSEGGL